MGREVATVSTGVDRHPSKHSHRAITDKGMQSCANETMITLIVSDMGS